jgi:hypothetical protein
MLSKSRVLATRRVIHLAFSPKVVVQIFIHHSRSKTADVQTDALYRRRPAKAFGINLRVSLHGSYHRALEWSATNLDLFGWGLRSSMYLWWLLESLAGDRELRSSFLGSGEPRGDEDLGIRYPSCRLLILRR